MELTPHWQKTRDSNPVAHAFLRWLAGRIYEVKASTILCPVDGVPDRAAATAEGLATAFADGRLEFANAEVRDEYLVRYAAELLDLTWDDPAEFTDEFAEVLYRFVHIGCTFDSQAKLLLLLATEQERDIVGRTAELAERAKAEPDPWRQKFWNVYPTFCQALRSLRPEPEALANALHNIAHAAVNSSAAGEGCGAVREIASSSPEYAGALTLAFLARSDSPTVSYVPDALVGLARSDLSKAYRIAEDLTRSDLVLLRRAGIATLGLLPYQGPESEHLIIALGRLRSLLSEPDPGTDYVLLRAMSNLLDLAPDVGQTIPDLARRGGSLARYQAALLLEKRGSLSAEPWYVATLLAMAYCDSQEENTLMFVDDVLAKLAVKNPNVPLKFLQNFLFQFFQKAEDNQKLNRLVGRSLQALITNQRVSLQSALTNWLASSEPALHAVAVFVIRYATEPEGNQSATHLLLDTEELAAMPGTSAISLLQRALARLGAYPEAALELLLSAIATETESEVLIGFVESALRECLLYNYPGKVGDHLRRHLEEDDLPVASTQVARRALAASEAYFEALRQLPHLPELRTPRARRFLVELERREIGKRIHEGASRGSALMSLMTTIPVKFGGSFSIEMEEGFTEPANMSSHYHQVEFPRGEMINPVGEIYQRLTWARAGLEELPIETPNPPCFGEPES